MHYSVFLDDIRNQMYRCTDLAVRFVLGEEADKVLEDAREVLESMEISTEDRLIGALRGSKL